MAEQWESSPPSFSSEIDPVTLENLKKLAEQQAETVKITKKPEQSGLVHDDLKEGMHVKLKCGCEGFVKTVMNADSREDRWFSVLNTKAGCRSPNGLISLETLYAEAPDNLRIDTYHSDAFRQVLPAFECPAPSWFKSMKDVPKSSNERRGVRVRISEGIDFIIPGALMNTSVYAMATSLREALKRNVDIEVFENQDGITSENLGKAPELFKKLSTAKNQTIEEKNAAAFYSWAILMLYVAAEDRHIVESGVSVLSRETLRAVLSSVKKHPMWKGHKVEVTSRDQYVVTLQVDGTIS